MQTNGSLTTRPIGQAFSEGHSFPELLSVMSPSSLRVHRITTDPDVHSDTRGMQFTPDGTRAIFRRPIQVDKTEWVRYALCELDDGFPLRMLTTERTVGGSMLTPDGRAMLYFSVEPVADRERVLLKRISLETFRTETVLVFDKPVEGIGRIPVGISGSASLRRDGAKICAGLCFSQDDSYGNPHFNNQRDARCVVIDLGTLTAHGWAWEPETPKTSGGTYYPGDDPAYVTHLLMARFNFDLHARKERGDPSLHGLPNLTLHIVSEEEGRIVATVPIGGKGETVDHAGWRGGRYEIVTHSGDFNTEPFRRGPILCARPVACAPEAMYLGNAIPGGRRIDLTRRITRPDVCHHSWDHTGMRVVCDTEGWQGRGSGNPQGPAAYLYLGTVVEQPGEDPYLNPAFLLLPRSSWNWAMTENSPVLSPDCKTVFFTTDYLSPGDRAQLCAVQGFEFPL